MDAAELARRARRAGDALSKHGTSGTAALVLVDLGSGPPSPAERDAAAQPGGGVVHPTPESAIRSVLRPGDTVARLDAHRYLVLCERLDHPRHVEDVAHRIQGVLGSPQAPSGPAPQTHVADPDRSGAGAVRVHVAVLGDGRDPVEALGGLPEGAAPSEPWVELDESQRHGAADRERVRAALRSGGEDAGLELRYQPIASLATGTVAGVEALARWRLDGRLVPPSEFVPFAEETGAIVRIGRQVLRSAAEQVARWQRDTGNRSLRLAVNVAADQLDDDELAALVAEVLGPGSLQPGTLWLEITESQLLEDLDHAADRLADLAAAGARLALDDFGTGWSSLSYLRQLPVDAVKLDRSLLAGVGRSDEDTAIVRAVIGLLHELGRQSIAEGVERPDQLELLRQLGCDSVQGTLVAPPLEASELEALLRRGGGVLEPPVGDRGQR